MSELNSLTGLLLRSRCVVNRFGLCALTVPTWFTLMFYHRSLVYFKVLFFVFFTHHVALFEKVVS